MNKQDIAMMPIVGVIPSYKPDEKLEETIRKSVEELHLLRIVVVDDGSGPDFAAVFDGVANVDGVTVIHLAVNSGMGGAIKYGIQYALYHYPEVKGFVMFDADGQHDPVDVRRVAEEYLKGTEKLVLGVRDFHDPSLNIPLRSRFGNRVTELIFRFFTGIPLSDTQTGLRCYPIPLARELTQIKCSRYEFQLEALLIAAGKYEYVQVPIKTIYEENNRRSHFNPVKDSIRIYSVFLRFIGSTAICSVIDYVVFALMFMASSVVLSSMIVARVISVSINFVLNKQKVFHSKGNVFREIVGFLLLALFLFSVSYGGVSLLKHHLGMNPLVSKILVEVTLFMFSYCVQRFLIFARRKKSK